MSGDFPLYAKAEVREITRSFGFCESHVVKSAEMPWRKYSSDGALLIFAKGSTAIDGCSESKPPGEGIGSTAADSIGDVRCCQYVTLVTPIPISSAAVTSQPPRRSSNGAREMLLGWTRYTRTASEMFLTCCSPIKSYRRGSLFLTLSNTAPEM